MLLRRTRFTVVFFLFLLSTSYCFDFPFSRHKHNIKAPIKTVVVLVMENRSFDHILGWLKKTRPDIDGLTGSEFNRLNASDHTSPKVYVSEDAVFVDSDPGHSIQAIREQIFGSNESFADPAPMNGFVQQAESMNVEGMSRTVMSGFRLEYVPVYSQLANEFAVFDRWFASVPSSTQPPVLCPLSHLSRLFQQRTEGPHPWFSTEDHLGFFGRKWPYLWYILPECPGDSLLQELAKAQTHH